MSHPDELLLLQYRFDTLEDEQKTRVADHLRTCAGCTARYATMGRTVDQLEGWNAEAELSDDVVDRALDHVRLKAIDPAKWAAQRSAASPPPATEPPPAPAAKQPAPPLDPFPGVVTWLGLRAGPGSSLRFALSALMAVALAGLGGGELYWNLRTPQLQTVVSAPSVARVGDRTVLTVDVSRADRSGPVAGANVQVVVIEGERRSVVFDGISDDAGHATPVFELPETVAKDARFEVVTRALGEVDTLPQPMRVVREAKLHVSSDKPLYQPGQTIHARALAQRSPSGKPLVDAPLTFEVLDPKGNRLGMREVKLGRFGVGSLDFELADEIPLGTYAVKVTAGDSSARLDVEVARYTLPKFSIALSPERDGYLAGETMRVRVIARTFFGKPVGHATVGALLVREGGALAAQAKATTSGDGDAVLELQLPSSLAAPGAPEALKLQVEVSDAAAELEKKQLVVTVARELLAVTLVPAQGGLVGGVENEIFALVTTPDGKPVAAVGTLQLGGETVPLATGPNGVGVVRWTAATGAAATVHVNVTDSTGRTADLDVVLPGSRGDAMALSLDRGLVSPTETVQVTVHTRGVAGAYALELERDGHLVDRQPLPSLQRPGAVAVKIAIPAGLTGALELRVVPMSAELPQQPYAGRWAANVEPLLPRPTAPLAARRLLSVEPKGLTVSMTADQSTYRPGATARLRFEVKDAAGKPAAAALGVAVVDESVFALSTARPGLARAFFALGASLHQARGPIAATDFVSGGWSEADQRAAQLLFAGAEPTSLAERQLQESLALKTAELERGQRSFARVAHPGWLVWFATLGLVLVFVLSRYAWPWLGGVALSIVSVALIAVSGEAWVGALMVLGAIVTFAAVVVSRRRMPWGLVVIPAVCFFGASFLLTTRRAYPVSASMEAAMPLTLEKKTLREPGIAARVEAVPPELGAKQDARVGGLVDATPPRREVRVRQYFPETLFVHPELVTDEQGVAQLEVPIADSITSWRVTATASSAAGTIGGTDAPLRVFQDFFVDLDLPVALVAGDTATVPIAVHNYLDEPQTVRLEVKPAAGFEVMGNSTFDVKVGANTVAGAEVKLRMRTAGRHTLNVHADGTHLSDEIAKDLRVFEAGEERSMVVSGTLQPGKVMPVVITLPPSAQPGSARLVARVFGSRLASAVSGLEGAIAAPHGCFEQTSSTTYPNVLIWKHLLDIGDAKNPAIERARQYVGLGYQRLLSFEVRGGGFEWFGRAPANQVLTAYGLLEFRDMAKVFPVDPAVIARTQDFLVARQRADGAWQPDASSLADGLYRSGFAAELNVSAYIAWALAESGYRGPALERAAQYLADRADQTKDPYTLALITGTLARTGHAQAAAVATRLQTLAQRDEGKASFSPEGATVYYSRGTGASAEATALAAQALSAAQVAPDTVRGALLWLAANRDAHGTWHSTQGTVMALRAILMGEANEGDQTVKVSANGGQPSVSEVRASTDRPATVDLLAKVKQGDNVVTLEGDKAVPFQVVLTWVQPWREPGADERAALSLKVALGRTKARIGDIVPVALELTYRQAEASGMVVASLGVPAGLQVLTEDLEALKNAGRLSRYEVGPGVVNLYLDRVATGAKVSLGLRLKAVAKVSTSGQGSMAYLYYHPEVRAKAKATGVTVE